ncbi:MAG: CRISPR-associated protein Cas4 [Verrucomicrobiae bacterium]
MSDPLPLSLLNDYLYCPRRAALKINDGLRSANEHTLRGDLNHEHADLPGFEHRAGWKLLRALPVWSDRLGLNGKADIVEVRESGGRVAEARPVEYKSGKKAKWLNDRVQLCAQAICLEEMLGIGIPEGMIFHAKSQQRTRVDFDSALRDETLEANRQLHALLAAGTVPPAEPKPQCEGCSLHDVCLPEAACHRRFHLFEAS